MSGLVAASVVLAATIGGIALVTPAARRTRLGPWHPTVAWIVLELLFFGLGAAILALVEGVPDPATYVAGALLAFAIAVAASDRLASRRAARLEPPPEPPDGESRKTRTVVVATLAAVGFAVLAPTLLTVGIPLLAGDITTARTEVGGLDLQVIRVTLPAAVLVAILWAVHSTSPWARPIGGLILGLALAAELALGSRYLAVELVAAVIIAIAIAGRRIPLRGLGVVLLVGGLLFGSIGVLRAYDQAAGRELAFAIERTVNRVLLIQPRTLAALQEAIPAERPFFGGLTWVHRLAPLVGRDDVPNLGYWAYARMFPNQEPPGYAAPGLVGEAWANFGWPGLSLFALLGVVAERIGALIARRRRATADVAAAALLTLFVARTHALGVNGLLILVGLVALWRLLAAPLGTLGSDLRAVAAWRA